MLSMRPTDVLLHRRIMLDNCRIICKQDQSADDDESTEIRRDVARGLIEITTDCEAYYVSEDMTAVAKAAARSMPRQELRRDDLPTERGFMLYDSPVVCWDPGDGPLTVDGFAWRSAGIRDYGRKYPDAECVCPPKPYCAACDGGPLPCTCPGCQCAASEPAGEGEEFMIYPLWYVKDRSMYVPLYGDHSGGEMTWIVGDIPCNTIDGVAESLLATWTLMQQSLSVCERAYADRAERRRSARANLPSEIVVIRLRRRSIDGKIGNDSTDERSWTHQWLVNGHWRNQWLPSRAAHRLQWISAYVKGPSDKPFIVKDHVTAWVR